LHPSALAKRVYLFLFLFITAFYLYGLGQIPLLGPDEPRYAQVAREMFLSGDFITPTLGGHTWFEKPSLLYWMIAAAFKVFGVSDWSARLGPAVCGLLTIAAVWCVGRKVDDGFGFWSLIVTASSLGLIVFSRATSFDVVITMTVTWSLACFLFHELKTVSGNNKSGRGNNKSGRGACPRSPNSGGKPPFLTCSFLLICSFLQTSSFLIGFYAFVGLSLLAKGLVGIVIPFGVVFVYYLLRRKWPDRSVWLSLLWGVPLAIAVSAIWYGPVIAKHGWTFVDEFVVQHHFARYVSNKYHHPQPIWFYPVIILMLTVPWTAFFVEALIKSRRWTWRGMDSISTVRLFALAWLLFPIVFFSFSGSKLPGYVLPSLTAAALLVADVIRHRKAVVPIAMASVTVVLVLVALLFFAEPLANRESVRDLLLLADARGYANAPVLARGSDDRSAEFYAHDRVVYDAHGEPVKFDEISVAEARARGEKFVVFIPLEDAEVYRSTPGIEIIGDNGRTAVLGWKP
jgi:4-amino-4-deoxy-L-arabinose transferase-like glycosyltransferase